MQLQPAKYVYHVRMCSDPGHARNGGKSHHRHRASDSGHDQQAKSARDVWPQAKNSPATCQVNTLLFCTSKTCCGRSTAHWFWIASIVVDLRVITVCTMYIDVWQHVLGSSATCSKPGQAWRSARVSVSSHTVIM